MRQKISNGLISIEVADHGAELKSLKCDGVEYIWYSKEEYWKYCAPFLFPMVGTLKDKQTIINDKVYKIPQHGIVRIQDFKFLGAGENSLSFVNEWSDEFLDIYPFKYQFKVNYYLNGYELKTEIIIKNLGDIDMPFNIGGHPAFNIPMFENEEFTDYRIEFEKKETFESPRVMSNATLNFDESAMSCKDIDHIDLNKNLFNIDTIINTNVKSKSVKLLNKENKGIKFSYPKFKTLAIWTPFNDAPFVCIEPWIGYNDHHDSKGYFVEKDDIVTLKPNEEFTVEYMIEIIK